jgi:hypothetical protein
VGLVDGGGAYIDRTGKVVFTDKSS